LRLSGTTTVQSASARRFDPRSQAQSIEDIADEFRSLHDLPPRYLRSRIEIPYEPVRTVDIVGGGIPRMDLDDPHLCERHDGLD